jgi:hypothetical protein
VLLVGLTLAIWGGVVGGDFQFDDHHNIVQDAATVEAGALVKRLATGVRPLLRLSYHLDHRLWGMRPGGFLATNLVLHLLTVLGVWTLARRRLGDDSAALVAGLAFALQPAGAEVVAYVSGRSTGLMSALVVGGLVCHERAREGLATGAPAVGWRVTSFVCFAAACLAKEVALVFPALLLLWEWTRPGAGRVPRGVIAMAGVAAAGLLLLLATSPRYRALAAFSLALRDPLETLVVNLHALPVMLSLWVRPWALSIEHDLGPMPSPWGIAIGVGVAGVFAGGLLLRRRNAHVALAAGWVLLALAPTSSVIAKLDPVTEKPLYLAWIGPALLLGVLAIRLRAWMGARRAALVAVPIAAAAAWFTLTRVAVWSDARLLWADAAAKAPGRARAWTNLGVAWMDRDPAFAARALREALARDPRNVAARRALMTLEVLCGPDCERRS